MGQIAPDRVTAAVKRAMRDDVGRWCNARPGRTRAHFLDAFNSLVDDPVSPAALRHWLEDSDARRIPLGYLPAWTALCGAAVQNTLLSHTGRRAVSDSDAALIPIARGVLRALRAAACIAGDVAAHANPPNPEEEAA